MLSKIKKWKHWEFWPLWFFYIPLYVKYFWMSFKARSLAFFTASNPLMKHGGFVDYSKYKVLKAIDTKYLPTTEFFEHASEVAIIKRMQAINLDFPVILKPDKGERGFGVEKINSGDDLKQYFNKYGEIEALILQEYIDFPIEVGVMYSRKASEQKGKITSVVLKEFLTVVGDGEKNLKELFETDNRAAFYRDDLLNVYENELALVLPLGHEKKLVAIGNHCRGTTFLNANHLINDNLHRVFDEISIPIHGFHFGRYDLRVPSLEALYKGDRIKIIELNGAASEPAHIYDPNMPIQKAYKYLFAHWQRLYDISIENRKNGSTYSNSWQLYLAMRNNVKFKKQVNIKSETK